MAYFLRKGQLLMHLREANLLVGEASEFISRRECIHAIRSAIAAREELRRAAVLMMAGCLREAFDSLQNTGPFLTDEATSDLMALIDFSLTRLCPACGGRLGSFFQEG